MATYTRTEFLKHETEALGILHDPSLDDLDLSFTHLGASKLLPPSPATGLCLRYFTHAIDDVSSSKQIFLSFTVLWLKSIDAIPT